MKRLLVLVSVGALLLLGVAINNVGDDAPVLSSDGGSPTVEGALPSLGPVSLTALAYDSTATIPCVLNMGGNKAQCNIKDYNPSIPGFTFSGATVVGACTTLNLFTLQSEGCRNKDNALEIDVDITHNVFDLPCNGVAFGQVVLSNGMDTLTLTLLASSTEVSGGACSD